jgi:hypothetical protein
MLAAYPQTFQNAVEKNQWKGVVLSGDSEHVVGAVHHKTEHRVYIWSRLYGKLERILEGGCGVAGHCMCRVLEG